MNNADYKSWNQDEANRTEHRADPWINTLYTGGPGADARNKLRRGFEEGHAHAIRELLPWLPDDAPHKHPVGLYEGDLFLRAEIGDVVVPKNPFHERHQFMCYATADSKMEFERVRVHGKTGWLRRS